MTTDTYKTAGLLAVACAFAFTPDSAHAAIVYNDGDLILGFRATGGQGANTDYLIDLGNASSFLTSIANNQMNLSLGPIATDLAAIYGVNWSSRVDVFWSLSGVQKIGVSGGLGNNTMFATRFDDVAAPLGTNTTTPWARPSSFAAGTPAGKMQLLGQKYGTGTTGSTVGTDQIESATAPGALIQPTSQINSYFSFQPNGVNTNGASAFSYFVDANGIEGNFGGGTAASVLDFYQLTPGSGPATFIGNVTINDAAVVTATGAGFVPEPSVAVSLMMGLAAFASMRRRAGKQG